MNAKLTNVKLFGIVVLALIAAATGCTASGVVDETNGDGGDAPVGGQGGTTAEGGAGGEDLGPCGQDCTLIDAPDCFVAVCNTGMHPGPVNTCTVVAANDGSACDDSQFCTVNDSCVAGVCTGGPQNTCGLGLQACQVVSCDENTDSCDFAPAPNGAACSPNDLCDVNGTCTNGLCVGQPKDCFFAPVSECNVATCNPANGLCEGVPDPAKDGSLCQQSGDPCMVNKLCNAGDCLGGTPKDCSFLTVGCTNGLCDQNNGNCIAEPVPAGGMCLDATDECNIGICDANASCNPVPVADNTSCNDFNSCTTSDICTGGVCNGSAIANCTTYFENNFENGCAGWTLGGIWQCGVPTSGPGSAAQGANVLATNLTGLYAANATYATDYAQTPPIDLSTATSPVLSFLAWVHTEGSSFDGFNVKISTNGGATFSVVNTTVTPAYNLTVASEPAWGGNMSAQGYQLYTVDLSSFAPQVVILRLSLRTDFSGQFNGVYVDNFSVGEPESIPLWIETSSLPDGFIDSAYEASLTKTGGGANSVWSIVGGTNHSWLSINPMTGALSGTPLSGNAGAVSVTLRVEEPSVPTNFDEVTYNFNVLPAVIYAQQFEGTCPNGWALTGTWQCGVPTVVGPTTAFDGAKCLGTNLTANYAANLTWAGNTATSPAISLAGTTAPQLMFHAWVDTEGSTYDGFNLRVSTDGVNYNLHTLVQPAYTLTIDSEQAWGGHVLSWQLYTADLTAFAGQTVNLRFGFRSDSIVQYPGVYVDRVLVDD